MLLLFIDLGKILLGIYCTVCHYLCNRLHCDQECYRSHDMYWFKSIIYFRMRLLLCSLWVSLYYCCTLIFQVAWTLWVILVNYVILWLSSFSYVIPLLKPLCKAWIITCTVCRQIIINTVHYIFTDLFFYRKTEIFVK